ncbi:hypothetical protein NA57DRAFT_57366 [Rhizodiscina lignyota]|uniref:Uncharacterized protein n=1 Tax=Rhizodiscina lignyota TaxID=1504668 RepID=A0A9P4M4Y3_9PEZI|nr:hypothetical protein NA57DRAFT_57366 [Rhizodiscina lignyota]
MARVDMTQEHEESDELEEVYEYDEEDGSGEEARVLLHGSDLPDPHETAPEPIPSINDYYEQRPPSTRQRRPKTPAEDAPSRQLREELLSGGSLISTMGAAILKEDHINNVVAATQRRRSSPHHSPTAPRQAGFAPAEPKVEGKLRKRSGPLTEEQRAIMSGAKRMKTGSTNLHGATNRSKQPPTTEQEDSTAAQKQNQHIQEPAGETPTRRGPGRPRKDEAVKKAPVRGATKGTRESPRKAPATVRADRVEQRAAEKAAQQRAAAEAKRATAANQKRPRGRPTKDAKKQSEEDELFIQQAEGLDEEEEEEEEEEEAEAAADEDHDDDDEEEEEGMDELSGEEGVIYLGDAKKLCGQYKIIAKIKKVVSKPPYRGKPTTKQVKDLYFKCKEVKSQIEILIETPTDQEEFEAARDAVEAGLSDMRRLASRLNPDTDKKPKEAIHDIYTAAFPSLVFVLWAYCNYAESPAHGGIDEEALEAVAAIADVIISLRGRAIGKNGWKTKPDANDGIVKPIVNNVISPLRKVSDALKREATRLQKAAEEKRRVKQQQARQRRQEAEERLEREKLDRMYEQQKRLSRLFLARVEAEPYNERKKYLGVPCSNRSEFLESSAMFARREPMRKERDANGMEFERVDAFEARKDALGKDMREWSVQQRSALMEGLQRFEGRKTIFCDIFRDYCGVYRQGRLTVSGPLREFKVHEILREVDYLQRSIAKQSETDFEVEVPDCLAGNIPDLDLIDFIWEKYGL